MLRLLRPGIPAPGRAVGEDTRKTKTCSGALLGNGGGVIGGVMLPFMVYFFKMADDQDPNRLWLAGVEVEGKTGSPQSAQRSGVAGLPWFAKNDSW